MRQINTGPSQEVTIYRTKLTVNIGEKIRERCGAKEMGGGKDDRERERGREKMRK